MIKIQVKMRLIIFHVGVLIVGNYALFNSELLSSYPLRKEYSNRLTNENDDVFETCPGFECNLSGLNSVQVNEIVEKENDIRDRYARQKNVTNIYSVQWSPFLAAHAHARSFLSCVLPATGSSTIYEHVTNQWYTENITSNSSLEDWPTAVETVMGSRTFARKDRDELLHTISEFIELFNKNDNISNPLERRGGTVEMGCSYLVTANQTHITDYMVCLYGFLYFDPHTAENKYNNEIGTPCSRCTFYSNIRDISEMSGQQWNCGHRHSHTCTNLSKRHTYESMNPNQFDCERKFKDKLKKKLFLPSQHGELEFDSEDISITDMSNAATKRAFGTSSGLITLVAVLFTDLI